MPDTTLLDIPQEEQDQMLAALRRARYGYLLAFHVLLRAPIGSANPSRAGQVLKLVHGQAGALQELRWAELPAGAL